MNVLFCWSGGEFGWEIAYWQGWVRRQCETTYSVYHKAAMSFPGHDVLYNLVDEFLPFPSFVLDPIRDHQVQQSMEFLVNGAHLSSLLKVFLHSNYPDYKIIWYDRATMPHQFDHKLDLQSLVKLVPKLTYPGEGPFISIFPRYRQHDQFRNWSASNWKELTQYLRRYQLPIVAIGSVQSSLQEDIGADIYCIGKSIDEQVYYLSKSKLAITPMCGAIRFAQLVGVPLVTFSSVAYLEQINKQEHHNILDSPLGRKDFCLTKEGWDISVKEMCLFLEENKCVL